VKLPAVAIAASFVGGIVLGLSTWFARASGSQSFLLECCGAACVSILVGLVFLRLGRLTLSATASLLAWVVLGVLSAAVAQQPLPSDHAVRLVDSGQRDLHSPLRWYGTLRDEPVRPPWGYGYEIDLTGVDYHGTAEPLQGGLRLSFTPHADDPAMPDVHRGRRRRVLTQAKRPQVFRDNGAFDRRAYLATQNVDVTATLRAPQLFTRVARVTAATAE
jgi:hypothetical protein